MSAAVSNPLISVKRLNYIGSKYKLLDWLHETILSKTGWSSLENRRIADIFAGTGIVSYYFRLIGSVVLSNDVELYSYVISHALTRSIYAAKCAAFIERINLELTNEAHANAIGFITLNYSPFGDNERMFFTVDNAKRIDYIRQQIEIEKPDLSDDEYIFLLASLLVSADAVSNVPAVYGCYLKSFKQKSETPLCMTPIHTNELPAKDGSNTYHYDVLTESLLGAIGGADIVYLDPPYNERQYSKNYFPLNMIAKSPENNHTILKGKTGIPTDCFLSSFCKKRVISEDAFERLFQQIDANWIFMSYSSESIVPKEKIMELAAKYGEVSVVEKEYKRFKSFEYNKDLPVTEYLFCLRKDRR